MRAPDPLPHSDYYQKLILKLSAYYQCHDVCLPNTVIQSLQQYFKIPYFEAF